MKPYFDVLGEQLTDHRCLIMFLVSAQLAGLVDANITSVGPVLGLLLLAQIPIFFVEFPTIIIAI